MYDRHCLHGNQNCTIKYSGRQDSLHFLSSRTAAGDEIGWDFINEATSSETPISAFCLNITEVYYETHISFMSRPTFTDFIFSWMSNFKVDFRQPCSTCGYNPKILACDGTKIGIFFRNATSTDLMEAPTCDDELTPVHTRCDRQFFCYKAKDSKECKQRKRQAQQDLTYFVAKFENKLDDFKKQHKNMENRSELERTQSLLTETPVECIPLITKFIEGTSNLSHDLLKHLCRLFKLLASGSPMTSLFHYRFIPFLLSVLSRSIALEKLKDDMPEIYNILSVATCDGELEIVTQCFKYIIHTVQEIHSNDRETGSSDNIISGYNPEATGQAYYFTPHGGRVRHLPKYNMSKNTHQPSPSCRKKFVDVTKSGMTYLFLWFDPLHGHCYGFHIIKSSEGRKDPFASLFSFMPDCPNAVYYDFSCQLEEFCLNREPRFWRDCRFFHDIFHGYSHKCPYVYNSQRVPAFDVGVNSEICEQFNSYIQKIKFSARSMNQSHFVFYMQFFIHLWNEKKARALAQEKRVARSLMT